MAFSPFSATWRNDILAWISGTAATFVTAASTFGTDNRFLRSDGTGRGAQASPVSCDDSGNITGANSLKVTAKTSSAGIGYAAGAGGTVTQLTDKSTAVTLNAMCGWITMNNAALAADAVVTFTVNNSAILDETDILIVNHINTGVGNYLILPRASGAGTAAIVVRNVSTGSLSQALLLYFAIIRGATS